MTYKIRFMFLTKSFSGALDVVEVVEVVEDNLVFLADNLPRLSVIDADVPFSWL